MSEKSVLMKRQADKTLLEIALDLHTIKTGSLETYEADELVKEYTEILQEALRIWQPSNCKTYERFDECVRELIKEVLAEPYWLAGKGMEV